MYNKYYGSGRDSSRNEVNANRRDYNGNNSNRSKNNDNNYRYGSNGYKGNSGNGNYKSSTGKPGGNYNRNQNPRNKDYLSKGKPNTNGKRPYSPKDNYKKPENKSFFKKNYSVEGGRLTKEEKKLYFKRRYNVYDNTITVKVFSRKDETSYRLCRTVNYFEFDKEITKDDIINCIDKSVMSAMIMISDPAKGSLSDDLLKRVEIYVSNKYKDIVKTEIFEKYKSSASYIFQYIILDGKGTRCTPIKY